MSKPLSRLQRYQAIAVLGVGGTLFSGYLTFYRVFTGKCALGEGCPIVLGMPACVYGFAMFLIITALAANALFNGVERRGVAKAVLGVTIAGALFAGFLTAGEIAAWVSSGRSYALILPSCFYGLIFYVAIFTLTVRLVGKPKDEVKPGVNPDVNQPAA